MRSRLANVIKRAKFYLNQIGVQFCGGVEFLAFPKEQEVAINTRLELSFTL